MLGIYITEQQITDQVADSKKILGGGWGLYSKPDTSCKEAVQIVNNHLGWKKPSWVGEFIYRQSA